MEKHLRECAAAAAIALSSMTALAMPNASGDLLQSRIAIQWDDHVQGLANILAQRLEMPYVDSSTGSQPKVKLQQDEEATLGQALDTINGQLTANGLELRIAQGTQGQQLVLAPIPSSAQAVSGAVASIVIAPDVPAAQPTLDVPVPVVVQEWSLSPADGTLRTALNKWAAKAGWQLLWEASVDLPIPVAAKFNGDFRSAVTSVFGAISASEVSLNALLYSGNQVLRVTESGHRSK